MTASSPWAAIALLPPGARPAALAMGQPVDLATFGSLPGYGQALVSFLLVAVFGGVILHWSEPRVRRSLEAVRERPYSAVPYGLAAYLVALVVGVFGLSRLGQVGGAGEFAGWLLGIVVAGVVVSLTAFGFLVVGTLLTDVWGRRNPTYGLVLGAGLSSVGWLVLPTAGGLAVWVVVAAFGIGGAARRWFHAERTVETERAT